MEAIAETQMKRGKAKLRVPAWDAIRAECVEPKYKQIARLTLRTMRRMYIKAVCWDIRLMVSPIICAMRLYQIEYGTALTIYVIVTYGPTRVAPKEKKN